MLGLGNGFVIGSRQKIHLERDDRKRRPRAETRIGCGAKFRVRHDRRIEKYVVMDGL